MEQYKTYIQNTDLGKKLNEIGVDIDGLLKKIKEGEASSRLIVKGENGAEKEISLHVREYDWWYRLWEEPKCGFCSRRLKTTVAIEPYYGQICANRKECMEYIEKKIADKQAKKERSAQLNNKYIAEDVVL